MDDLSDIHLFISEIHMKLKVIKCKDVIGDCANTKTCMGLDCNFKFNELCWVDYNDGLSGVFCGPKCWLAYQANEMIEGPYWIS